MARNNTIDIMKGIAIIAVIAGHVFPLDSLGRQLIYSFHMPLFFIVAGYLFKPNTNYRKKLSADFSRLLVPYLFIALCFTIYLLATYSDTLFALRYSFIAMIFGSACNHASYFWSAPPRIGAAWFLPALFWCRQIYNFVYCHTNNPRYIIATIAFTATITDFYLINLPFAILPGSSAMMFYMIGNVIRSRIIEKPVIIALSCK